MQTDEATLENNMEVPQKIKNRTPLQPSNYTTRFLDYPKDTKMLIQRVICTQIFLAALSTITKVWKELKCPLTNKFIKKMWYIYSMEYYLAVKKNEILPFATTWMELECTVLSEISQSEKEKYIISLICGI